jgi:hypothetical protein
MVCAEAVGTTLFNNSNKLLKKWIQMINKACNGMKTKGIQHYTKMTDKELKHTVAKWCIDNGYLHISPIPAPVDRSPSALKAERAKGRGLGFHP